jgi:beta-glucosidase
MKIIKLLFVMILLSIINQMNTTTTKSHPSMYYEQAMKMTSSLTLSQKIGQMLQMDVTTFLKKSPGTELDVTQFTQVMSKYHIGSLFNNQLNVTEWLSFINQIQHIAMSSGDSKIPILYGLDSVHGANYVIGATLFPQFGTGACAFNPELIMKQGLITAKDTRTAGVPWVFSPILEIGVTPLWSRLYEVFGEDPYLTSVLGSAIFKGLTSSDLKNITSVAACMKHFVGYSYPKTGHDHTNSEVSVVI